MTKHIFFGIYKYYVYDFLDLETQISLKQVSHYFYDNLEITNFSDYKYTKKAILKNILNKHNTIKFLTIQGDNFFNINTDNLLSLTIFYDKITTIHDPIYDKDTINCVNLVSLNLYNNNKNFNNINHLTNLTNLNAPRCNFINDSFINCTKLVKLDILGSSNITNLNFLPNLMYLNISKTNISNESINQCTKLRYLNITETLNIYDVNCFQNLETLYADCSMLQQSGIEKCYNIKIFHASKYISNVNHLTKLEQLNIAKSNIMPESYINCTKLTILNLCGNNEHNKIGNFPNLTALDACYTRISDFSGCPNLTFLNVHSNPEVTDINYLQNLVELYAGGSSCKLSNDGFFYCNIKFLYSNGNKNIVN